MSAYFQNLIKHPIKDNVVWLLFGFISILALVGIIYAPSLWHMCRSDQIVYYFVTADKLDWPSLALHSFDLNRTLTYASGDERLFRPLTYFILGTEKYFFGYNFPLWQLTGVLMHLIVCALLLFLLWRIKPSRVALIWTAFFGALFINMETVIWTHINSYMVFVMALIWVLYHVYQYSMSGKRELWRVILMAIVLLAASLIYETGVVFTVFIFAFLWSYQKDRSLLLLFVPIAIYGLWSIINWHVHEAQFLRQTAFYVSPFKWMKDAVVLLMGWFFAGIFPTELNLFFSARNMISSDPLRLSLSWGALLSVLTLLCYFKSIKIAYLKRYLRFILLLVVLCVVYAVVIAAGRGQNMAVGDIFRQNLHYNYIFWALVTVISYIVFQWTPVWSRMFCVLLLIVILINAYKLYQVNDLQAKGGAASVVLVKTVEVFIKEKQFEPGFSFYVSPQFLGNYAYQDRFGRSSTMIGMLFPRYHTALHPKYVFMPNG